MTRRIILYSGLGALSLLGATVFYAILVITSA